MITPSLSSLKLNLTCLWPAAARQLAKSERSVLGWFDRLQIVNILQLHGSEQILRRR